MAGLSRPHSGPITGLRLDLVLVAAMAIGAAGCGYDELLAPLEPNVVLSGVSDKIPGSYIVTFRNDQMVGLFADPRTEYRQRYFSITEGRLADPRIKQMLYITEVDLRDPGRDQWEHSIGMPSSLKLAWEPAQDSQPLTGLITQVDFKDDGVAAEVLKEWDEAGEIWFAEPNYINELMVQQNPTDFFGSVKAAATGWWHQAINLGKAYERIQTDIAAGKIKADEVFASPPVIAVIDSGVDILHPGLKDNIFENRAVGQALCEGDTNGCDTTKAKPGFYGVGTSHPYGLSGHAESCCPADEKACPAHIKKNCPHGTHVAGIAAGSYRAEVPGVGGICPFCKILPIKVVGNVDGKLGVAPDSAILNGLKYLTRFNPDTRIRVANSSFGKYSRSRAVALAVSLLRRGKSRIVVVGAAGNEDSMSRVYPAALDEALAVSAIQQSLQKASYSNYGPWVDIASPGGQDSAGIISTIPGTERDERSPKEGYGVKSGTSMATPVVAGLVGLMMTLPKFRDASVDAIKDAVISSSDAARVYDRNLGNAQTFNAFNYFVSPGKGSQRVPMLGAGLIDADKAIAGATNADTIKITPEDRVTKLPCGVAAGSRSFPLATTFLLLMGLLLPCLSGWNLSGWKLGRRK